jgi:hypothetical protein
MNVARHVGYAVVTAAVTAACVPLAPLSAQAPSTDIFLADLTRREGRIEIARPVNVTNRDGYDNQPWFLPGGDAFLYASERDGQNDIFRYEIATGESVRITDTPENEYSPSLPGDGSRMMVVRWPTDMSTGALWWFTPDGTPLGEATGSVPRVGYYTFADARTLALFINDSIQSFMLADAATGDTTRVGDDLGGSGPRAYPGRRAVTYLRSDDTGGRWLTRLDIDGMESTPLVRMPDDVVNYTWTPWRTVLAARGGTIYEWREGSDWRAVATFSEPELQGIGRIAVSDDGRRIALVAARP